MVTYGITQIKASAGSGKTYRLTELFLHRLESLSSHNTKKEQLRYDLHNIIAMTFTNKAVGEMKSSILKKLKATALGKEKSALHPTQANLWIDTILEYYTSFRIQSIDSTLLQLLQSIALSLGLPSNSKPLLSKEEEITLDTIYTQYIQQSLHNKEILQTIHRACEILVRESTDSSTLHIMLKKHSLELVIMILKRGLFLGKTHEEIDDILTTYEETIEILNREYGLKAQSHEFEKIIKAIKDGIEHYEITGINSHFLKALSSKSYNDSESQMFIKNSFEEVLTQKGKAKIHEQALAHMEVLYSRLRDIMKLKTTVVPCVRIASQSAPLVRIACALVAMLNEHQRKEGVIMFSSVPLLLSHYFTTPYRVYEALNHIGNSIHTIFFDEFQDTSQEQWYSLLPIIENVLDNNGSFIYVGDVKQAIYSWRGGDSSLFESIYTHMNYQKKKDTLQYNWRSAEPIVNLANIFSEMEEEKYASEFLQTLFSEKTKQNLEHLQPIINEGVQKLVEAYTKGRQEISSNTKHLKGKIRIIELIPINTNVTKDDEKKEDELENSEVNRIKRELESSLLEVLTYAQQKDIAILTRTNPEATVLSQWLLEWNLPHTIEGGIDLYSVPLIQHIILMLQFILTQSDASLYAVLYSLLCRDYILSEEECIQWRLQTKHRPLIQAFQESYQNIWNMYFEPFISQYTTYTPYQYIQECIRCFSLYKRFPNHQIYLDSLLEIAFQSDSKEVTSISKFLHHFEKYKEEYKVPSSENTDAIQILSIHKSKGLEFPIVYLPFTKAKKKKQSHPFSLYTIGDIFQGITVLKEEIKQLYDIPIFTKISSQHPLHYKEHVLNAIEEINLLYVAFTRAKKELHIITHPKDTVPELSFSQIIQYIITNDAFISKHNIKQTTITPEQKIYEYSTIDNIQPSITKRPSASNKGPSTYLCTGHNKHTLLELPPFDITSSEILEESEIRAPKPFTLLSHFPDISYSRKESKNIHTERGLLLHKALEYISMGFSLDQAIQHSCIHQDILYKYQQDLSSKLEWFMSQSFSSECLQEGLLEQRMISKQGRELRADKIIEHSNEWIVVEYKTGKAYKEHIDQIVEYMEVLHDIRQKTTRGILIYFDQQKDIPFPPDNIQIYSYQNIL